jgi:cbb3-type cytochrome oxidase maturation protein
MTVMLFLIPLALLLASGAVAAFLWCVKSGQLDDLDTPGRRMLHDAPVKARHPEGSALRGDKRPR